jgi:hypothetical protein
MTSGVKRCDARFFPSLPPCFWRDRPRRSPSDTTGAHAASRGWATTFLGSVGSRPRARHAGFVPPLHANAGCPIPGRRRCRYTASPGVSWPCMHTRQAGPTPGAEVPGPAPPYRPPMLAHAPRRRAGPACRAPCVVETVGRGGLAPSHGWPGGVWAGVLGAVGEGDGPAPERGRPRRLPPGRGGQDECRSGCGRPASAGGHGQMLRASGPEHSAAVWGWERA